MACVAASGEEAALATVAECSTVYLSLRQPRHQVVHRPGGGDVAEHIIERSLGRHGRHQPAPRAGRWAQRPWAPSFRRWPNKMCHLAVPGTRVMPRRAVVAYDRSPKAREALFVFNISWLLED